MCLWNMHSDSCTACLDVCPWISRIVLLWLVCFIFDCLFGGGNEQGERGRLILHKQSLQGQKPLLLWSSLRVAVQPIKSLQFPRKALFVPSLWHILAEVIMSQITALNHVRGKRLSRAFGRMTSTWKMSFFSPSMTVTFFFSSEKEIWKYRLTYRDQPLLSAMPDAMFHTQGSFRAPYSQYLFRISCLLLNKRQCPLQWPIFPSCLSYAPPSNLSDVVGCLVDFFSFSSFYFLAFLPYATRSVCSSGCSPGSHQSSFPRTATFAPLGFTTRWKPWPPELFCEIPDHLIVYPSFQMNNLSTLS